MKLRNIKYIFVVKILSMFRFWTGYQVSVYKLSVIFFREDAATIPVIFIIVDFKLEERIKW